MRYLLDANILTYVGSGDALVVQRLRALSPSEVAVSIVAVREVLSGTLATISRQESKPTGYLIAAYDHLIDLVLDLREINMFPYTDEAEAVFQAFPAKVKRVGTNDCRIAASAIAGGLTLVTRDSDFDQIPGVTVERW
jgi:tRNA(fMet)-specific endonuclease VapC